jgi:prepilin-type N-terminal cleavage/methylation domain-containing protein
MKKLRLNRRARKAFRGSSRGFTLIEVVIAMLLLGMIGVAILGSLSYASTILITVDRRATAESLAKTQMEYVKSQNYSSAPYGGIANYTKITDTPGYTICSVNRAGQPVNCGSSDLVIGIPWASGNNNATNNDTGLQKITVIIKYDILSYNITSHTLVGKNFTLEDYKRQS